MKITRIQEIHTKHCDMEWYNAVRLLEQESLADTRVTRDSAVIPRWPPVAILDIIEPDIAPFDPPTPKTLA